MPLHDSPQPGEIPLQVQEAPGSRRLSLEPARSPGSNLPVMRDLKNLVARLVQRIRPRKPLGTESLRLQELGQELKRLNTDTEKDFLDIGGYLQDFSGRAQEISAAATATAGFISGPELHEAISSLDHIFQETKVLEGECEKGTDILSDILKILDMVQASIAGFMRIVKTLTVLGTFIRVESARLGSMGSDFLTLANEITQLGKGIEEKCLTIFTKAQSLSSSLTSSLANIFKIKASQQGQLQVVIDKTMVSLGSLKDKQNIASATTEQIADNYQNISKNISNIVMSLQFHDITRQQIEHVDKALQNGLSLISEKDHKNGDRAKSLLLAQQIFMIQEGQLTIARDKLTQAVGAIITNLHSIAMDIEAITQQVQGLAGNASQAGKSFLLEMEEYLATVAEGLNLYGAARQDLWGLMLAVAPAIGDMSQFLLDIERIEIAIERIALNACIKAAHLGEEGAALGVLAEAAQNLVGDTRQQTQSVSTSLKSIQDAAQRLSGDQGQEEGQVEVDVATLVADLGALLKTLDRLNENVVVALTQMDQEGKNLSAGLTKAGGDITVHEYAREVLDHVIAGIHEMTGRLQAQPAGKDSSAELSPEELAHLKSQYTMLEERQIHDQILVSASAPAADEMAAMDNNDGNANDKKEEDGEFGDNIELF